MKPFGLRGQKLYLKLSKAIIAFQMKTVDMGRHYNRFLKTHGCLVEIFELLLEYIVTLITRGYKLCIFLNDLCLIKSFTI